MEIKNIGIDDKGKGVVAIVDAIMHKYHSSLESYLWIFRL